MFAAVSGRKGLYKQTSSALEKLPAQLKEIKSNMVTFTQWCCKNTLLPNLGKNSILEALCFPDTCPPPTSREPPGFPWRGSYIGSLPWLLPHSPPFLLPTRSSWTCLTVRTLESGTSLRPSCTVSMASFWGSGLISVGRSTTSSTGEARSQA